MFQFFECYNFEDLSENKEVCIAIGNPRSVQALSEYPCNIWAQSIFSIRQGLSCNFGSNISVLVTVQFYSNYAFDAKRCQNKLS